MRRLQILLQSSVGARFQVSGWPHLHGPLSAIAASSMMLSACAPNLGPRSVPATPSSFASRESLVAAQAPWPADEWWKAYGDPQLDVLEAEALIGAPDLRAAKARVRRAVGLREQP